MVRVRVSFVTSGFRELLDQLVFMMYHGCDVAEGSRADQICALMHLFGTSACRSAVGPAVRALGNALKSASSTTSGSMEWYEWMLDDECPIQLDADVKEMIHKCKVVADIAALTGWECYMCKGRSPHDMEHCRLCHAPKERGTAPPMLVRLPSDLDPSFFEPPPKEKEALDALTSVQRAAVDYVVAQAQPKSNAARGKLMSRLDAMGYTDRDLRRVMRYLRDEAPLIMHVNISKTLGFLVNDTHYRNQFETATSGGCLSTSARTNWEDRLYNNLYHSSSGYERVKYGVLNLTSDPHGVQCCSQYGESYMVLKNCRLRSSFADMDSSSPSTTLASVSCAVLMC